MIKQYSIALLINLLFLVSCDIKKNKEVKPDHSFLKIYDNNEFNASYIPLDIQQTTDSGYLILGSNRLDNSSFSGVYLLKVDKDGNYVSDQNLSDNYVHPVKNLMKINGQFYFVAMEEGTLQANLFVLDDAGQVTNTIALNTTYPLAVAADGSSIIMQSFNNNSGNTVLSVLNTSGTISGSRNFSVGVGDDVEEPIINHFRRTGRQLPFFVGKTDGGIYYFNGFYNYTISLVFTDLSEGDPNGVVQGQIDEGGVLAAQHIDGNTFALARFNYGDNYILPNVTVQTNSSFASAIDLEGNLYPELIRDPLVIIEKITIASEDFVLYGSTTLSGKIILMAFNESDGALRGLKYIGITNPYELAGFNVTADEGIAITGATYVGGKFARICLIKLSKEELEEMVQEENR